MQINEKFRKVRRPKSKEKCLECLVCLEYLELLDVRQLNPKSATERTIRPRLQIGASFRELGAANPKSEPSEASSAKPNPMTSVFRLFFYFSILSKEATIPFIREELKPLCSISLRPMMVHPFGVVTLSISCSGC